MRDWRSYYRDLLAGAQRPIVGIGVTAFNRIGPGYASPDYEVICYKHGTDILALRDICKVRSIQHDFIGHGDIRRNNSVAILRQQGVQNYLNSLSAKPMIFVYRSKKALDSLCEEQGWGLLANSSDIRDEYEMKKNFFAIGRSVGLPMISGTQVRIDELGLDEFLMLQKKLGDRLVFQLTEIFRGGGQGTFFINSIDDFYRFLDRVELFRVAKPKRKLTHVNVTKFIEGATASITGCVTRYGVLSGVVQTQVLDVPALLESDRDGVFLGHDWSYNHYGVSVQRQASVAVERLGSYMAKRGYKGSIWVGFDCGAGNEQCVCG